MTIGELANALFVDESSVRRALQKLTKQGVVQHVGTDKKDGAGRPAAKYINQSVKPTLKSDRPVWPWPARCDAHGLSTQSSRR